MTCTAMRYCLKQMASLCEYETT
eukprot:COSAG03_NODE_10484_length_648_cov_1.129326_2_plen_22_part_01